jgi:hypothetical protein
MTKSQKCKLAIVFEQHNGAMPSIILGTLASRLPGIGITKYLAEEPEGRTIRQSIKVFKANIQTLKDDERRMGFNTLEDCERKFEAFHSLDPFGCTNHFASKLAMSQNIELYQAISETPALKYIAVDLPPSKREECDQLGQSECLKVRDANFVERIRNECRPDIGIVFLIGLAHYKLVKDLANDPNIIVIGFAPMLNLGDVYRWINTPMETLLEKKEVSSFDTQNIWDLKNISTIPRILLVSCTGGVNSAFTAVEIAQYDSPEVAKSGIEMCMNYIYSGFKGLVGAESSEDLFGQVLLKD